MKNTTKMLLVLAVTAALCVSILMNFVLVSNDVTNIADIAIGKNGGAAVAEYDGGKIKLTMIDENGVIRNSTSFSRYEGGNIISVLDMAVDSDNNIYVLKNVCDRYSGDEQYQMLDVYNLSRLMFKRVQSHSLENEDGVSYRWMSLSGSLTLTGYSGRGTKLNRQSFDIDSVLSKKSITQKNQWVYDIDSAEGVAYAVPAGQGEACISGSGKVFYAAEDEKAREVYPNRTLETLMYAMYIAPIDGDTVYIGEQESGNMSILKLADGSTAIVKNGTEPFVGLSQYSPQDIVAMSMTDPENFIAAAVSTEGDRFELIMSSAGRAAVITGIRESAIARIGSFALWFIGGALAIFGVLMLIRGIAVLIANSRTLLIKLVFSAVPLLIVALVAFGFFSYSSYSQSIDQSFSKQVEDEGNMLTALFGTESFEEIEYPYDHSGEAYQYLIKQMNTRQIYTRSGYYEKGVLYTGVDNDLPCYYPFGVALNIDAINLYMKAAYTGAAQKGVISDLNGERLACVTPIGGSSADTVYLFETGILTSNVSRYTGVYLRNYCIISAVFVIAIGLVLTLIFMRVLSPLSKIKEGLEEFAKGNRSIRLQNTSTDELADIIRVFNMMANDIDAQIYNLQRISETYFRFIPQKVFRLLGKDNLSELELGSSVETGYTVLCVSLKLGSDHLGSEQTQQLTNRFFNIVNSVSDENGAVIFSDSANLRRLKIICPAGADNAVTIALSALSRIDAHNARSMMQNRLDVLFVLHKAEVFYGICGDEHRYVPTMVSEDFDYITEHEELFRQLSSRLIVTAAAYGEVDSGHYFNRFIGYPGDIFSEKYGLYDFYDSSSPEVTRLTNETKDTFDRALELYHQHRYYDAKNLFAVVLRENQYDNVARYYVFACERNIPSEG